MTDPLAAESQEAGDDDGGNTDDDVGVPLLLTERCNGHGVRRDEPETRIFSARPSSSSCAYRDVFVVR